MKLLRYVAFFLLLTQSAFAACGMGNSISGGQCEFFLTSASSSPVILPADWTSTNTIQGCGEGGKGGTPTSGLSDGGGAGGAYSKIVNLGDAAGTSEAFQVGAGNSATTTQFKNSSTFVADYGRSASTVTGGTGGLVANSVGTTKFAGGSGANGGGGFAGAGGGGGGGPNGAGANGAGQSFGFTGSSGGTGDNGSGGAGGAGGSAPGNPGAAGTEFDATHGIGGGGAGGNCCGNTAGGAAGLYCAGGGGGGSDNATNHGAGGNPSGGLIDIRYTPAASPAKTNYPTGVIFQGGF